MSKKNEKKLQQGMLDTIVLLRVVFSYWPSYRSEDYCIDLRRSRTPIQQTEDL